MGVKLILQGELRFPVMPIYGGAGLIKTVKSGVKALNNQIEEQLNKQAEVLYEAAGQVAPTTWSQIADRIFWKCQMSCRCGICDVQCAPSQHRTSYISMLPSPSAIAND